MRPAYGAKRRLAAIGRYEPRAAHAGLNNFGRASDLLNRYRPKPAKPICQLGMALLMAAMRSDALFTLTDKYDWVEFARSFGRRKMAAGRRPRGKRPASEHGAHLGPSSRAKITRMPMMLHLSSRIFSGAALVA